jgi:hypothetical protein
MDKPPLPPSITPPPMRWPFTWGTDETPDQATEDKGTVEKPVRAEDMPTAAFFI